MTRTVRFFLVLMTALLLIKRSESQQPAQVLAQSLQAIHGSGAVLDLRTGEVVAESGSAGKVLPGSVVKPVLLAYALEHGIVTARTTAYCRRDLSIAGRSVRCTHPADQVLFRAETALAESCNTWFAQMGQRFSGQQLEAALNAAHLEHDPLTEAQVDDRELAVLGLRGVRASPRDLVLAYAQMLQRLPTDSPVRKGLSDSVQYGMAHNAFLPGQTVFGKTGTASDPGQPWTHGWFVGGITGRWLVAVLIRRGDGGTAASTARELLQRLINEEHPR